MGSSPALARWQEAKPKSRLLYEPLAAAAPSDPPSPYTVQVIRSFVSYEPATLAHYGGPPVTKQAWLAYEPVAAKQELRKLGRQAVSAYARLSLPALTAAADAWFKPQATPAGGGLKKDAASRPPRAKKTPDAPKKGAGRKGR